MSNTKATPYYDFEIEIDKKLLDVSSIEDMFYLRDLERRKLFLDSDIEQPTISELAKHILQYNKEDTGIPIEERRPIYLYITCNGGDVDSGFELIDVIVASKTPVYTVNLGYAYSMGFMVAISGHKRFATRSSTYLIHDGVTYAYDSTNKAQDRMDFQRQTEQRVKQHILEHSKISSRKYESKRRVEWYLYASEAKEYGFVDSIIGVDCDIDEII